MIKNENIVENPKMNVLIKTIQQYQKKKIKKEKKNGRKNIEKKIKRELKNIVKSIMKKTEKRYLNFLYFIHVLNMLSKEQEM